MEQRRSKKLVLSKDTVLKLNPRTLDDSELRAAKGANATDTCVDLSLLTGCCVTGTSCRTCGDCW